eukprot:3605089-Pyramimonas_sp.AAC.1
MAPALGAAKRRCLRGLTGERQLEESLQTATAGRNWRTSGARGTLTGIACMRWSRIAGAA